MYKPDRQLIKKHLYAIKQRHKDAGVTIARLERSLALQELWPEIEFPATSRWEGRLESPRTTYIVISTESEVRRYGVEVLPALLFAEVYNLVPAIHKGKWRQLAELRLKELDHEKPMA